jgi:hypothetical protein
MKDASHHSSEDESKDDKEEAELVGTPALGSATDQEPAF